jgi:hypothetical protein
MSGPAIPFPSSLSCLWSISDRHIPKELCENAKIIPAYVITTSLESPMP